jgi:hypothetical protein
MAITSSTGTVDSNNVIYEIPDGYNGSARGEGVVSYIDYSKGASDTLVIRILFNDPDIDTNYYDYGIVDQGVLSYFEAELNASGKIRLPLPMAANEKFVKVNLTGLVDGDINIEFRIDTPYL